MSKNNEGLFSSCKAMFVSMFNAVSTVSEGVEEYASAFKSSGTMANTAVKNALEEQLLELDEVKAKRQQLREDRKARVIEHQE